MTLSRGGKRAGGEEMMQAGGYSTETLADDLSIGAGPSILSGDQGRGWAVWSGMVREAVSCPALPSTLNTSRAVQSTGPSPVLIAPGIMTTTKHWIGHSYPNSFHYLVGKGPATTRYLADLEIIARLGYRIDESRQPGLQSRVLLSNWHETCLRHRGRGYYLDTKGGMGRYRDC